jgi:hypothetical protein
MVYRPLEDELVKVGHDERAEARKHDAITRHAAHFTGLGFWKEPVDNQPSPIATQ